ncbi:MAG: serine/threonine protein kinase [Acidobacteria bacterium]|nr:serine/threonine protein kinase [Acidobacteriota bacterium]
MTPKERYLKIKEIFLAVSNLPQIEQKQYIQLTCQDQPALIAELEDMLKAEKAKNSLFEQIQQKAENLAGLAFEELLEQDTDYSSENTDLDEVNLKLENVNSVLNGYLALNNVISDRYKIEAELGRGGFAIVYLARDLRLNNKQVVVKILDEDILKEDVGWVLQKFLKEITALSKISHPNVVSIYDSGVLADGRPFFVMEYIKGKTLRSLLYGANTGISPTQVANIMLQLGDALSNVHRENIYHRDLKPENILVQTINNLEYVKIIDFGIATVKESANALTVTNSITGTPVYIAPEQLEGKPSASSDIYAMGVLAYELLTGRPPFNIHHFPLALSIIKLKELYKKPIILPSQLSPHLSSNIDRVILKAIAIDPKYRYNNALLFTEALCKELESSKEDNFHKNIKFNGSNKSIKSIRSTKINPTINTCSITNNKLETLFLLATKTNQIRVLNLSERELVKMQGLSVLEGKKEQTFLQNSKLSLAISLNCEGHLLLLQQEDNFIYSLAPSLFTANTYLRNNLILLPTQGSIYESLPIANKVGRKSILAIVTKELIKLNLPKPTIKDPAPKLSLESISMLIAQLQNLEIDDKKFFWTAFNII